MKAMFDNFSTWLTLIMLVIFTTMVLISLGYPAGARFMPLVVGIPGILLCLGQLVMDWFASHRPGSPPIFIQSTGPVNTSWQNFRQPSMKNCLRWRSLSSGPRRCGMN